MSDTADGQLQEMLATLDPSTRTLVAEADLGFQAREFMASDLGRHFVGCAHQELEDTQLALAKVSPWKFWKVQELQNRIWRAEFLLQWLRDLLISGKSAESVIAEAEGE